jgi:glycosyltransferase involved in cell wall biosynthesis
MSYDLRGFAESYGETVSVAGFVDDLEPEYAAAWVCVVPLREGAGVKFKTIESLIRGVPVVTTTVGAEGIEGPDLFSGVTDDAEEFTAFTAAVLQNPASAAARSLIAREWARREYSAAEFTRDVLDLYGIG